MSGVDLCIDTTTTANSGSRRRAAQLALSVDTKVSVGTSLVASATMRPVGLEVITNTVTGGLPGWTLTLTVHTGCSTRTLVATTATVAGV